MEVGAEGFAQHLPRLRRRILRAAFVALDMEFTGLHSTSQQNNEPSLFDSPAERYGKARQSVQRFTLVQLGLAIFSKENSNKYVVHSYNFFLFPSTLGIKDVEFTLSASSIQFLSHYGFDYNKFLKDGIPYMNEVQEKILRQHLLAGTWKVCSTSNADRDVLKKAIDEVTTWIGAAKEEDTMVLQDLSELSPSRWSNREPHRDTYMPVGINRSLTPVLGFGNTIAELRNFCADLKNRENLQGIICYHMIEVQLVLRQALENVWTEPLGDKKVMVKKVSPEHRQLLENSSYDRCQKKLILLSARGFTNLFQILVKVKKPLVGHNMLMDLMHLHDKFYRPLPESYEEFKRNIHNLFPVIIDTKTITKSMQKKCLCPRVSSLVEAYAVLCSNLNPKGPPCPVIALASGCSRYAEKKFPHEAGYDAFLCGSVLLMSAHLLLCRSTDGAVEAEPSFSQYLAVLAEHVNKVNFIRGGVSSINFSGEDSPCRHPPALVVHVRGWPGLTEGQIYQEFKARCCFDVRRLSKNQFILLSNKYKQVRHVLRDYRHHPHLQVSVYRHWRHSPSVNCLLQISGIVALWSLLAFVLGGARSC